MSEWEADHEQRDRPFSLTLTEPVKQGQVLNLWENWSLNKGLHTLVKGKSLQSSPEPVRFLFLPSQCQMPCRKRDILISRHSLPASYFDILPLPSKGSPEEKPLPLSTSKSTPKAYGTTKFALNHLADTQSEWQKSGHSSKSGPVLYHLFLFEDHPSLANILGEERKLSPCIEIWQQHIALLCKNL